MNWQLRNWEYLILLEFWVRLVDAGYHEHAREVYEQASKARNEWQ